jgi:hypothetical protein
MTYLLKRPTRITAQQPIAVVTGTPELLRFIDSNGEFGEGPSEEIWQRLAFPQPTTRQNVSRGKTYRSKTYTKYIVVTPRRGSIRELIRSCDATHWTGITKGSGKYHTLRHDGGPTVYRLEADGRLEDIATALFAYVDFLNENGAIFRSTVTGGGLALFRQTLDEPIKFWAPPVAVNAFWPGRSEYFRPERASFWNMAYYDLKQAYPTALSEEPIPTRWHHTNPDNWRKHPDGFSQATAFVPYDDLPPHPLQLRLNVGKKSEHLVYPTGVFSGWWNHRDMRIADDLGYIVRVQETWVPDHFTTAFQTDEWQELRQELRKLGALGKMADNGLWGLLNFDGTKQKRVRWTDKAGTTQEKIADINGIRETHAIGVGLSVTSRVREKLWHAIAATGAVYAATDGIIAHYPSPIPLSDQWVVKEHYDYLDIKDVGCYAWVNRKSPITQYLGGGKARFDAAEGKRGYLVGDLEANTIAAASIKELHKRKTLIDESNDRASLLL